MRNTILSYLQAVLIDDDDAFVVAMYNSFGVLISYQQQNTTPSAR